MLLYNILYVYYKCIYIFYCILTYTNISIISSCLGLAGAFGEIWALAKGAGTQGRQKDQQAAGNGIVRGRQMS